MGQGHLCHGKMTQYLSLSEEFHPEIHPNSKNREKAIIGVPTSVMGYVARSGRQDVSGLLLLSRTLHLLVYRSRGGEKQLIEISTVKTEAVSE